MIARTYRHRIVLLVVLLVVALGLPLARDQLAAQTRAHRRTERVAAEQRWQAAGLDRYQLDVQVNNCRYTSAVEHDTATIHNSFAPCTTQPGSVARLFQLAERDGQHDILCDTRGCPCESFMDVGAEYDPQLGYPHHLVIETHLRPAWLAKDLWNHIAAEARLPTCLQTNRSDIRVIALTSGP
jgi:hypothetical protein